MARLDQIHGKVLALVREYQTKEPSDGSGYVRSFFAGKGSGPFMSGFGLSWWLSERGLHILQNLAAMAVEYDPSLKGDPSTLQNSIENVFKEEFLDSQLFNAYSIHKADTLFDLIVPPPKDFAVEMWRRIHEVVRRSVLRWVVLIPLQRVENSSAELGFDGISLLAANDRDRWAAIAARYSDARLWNASTGKRRDDDPSFYGDVPPPTWLVAEVVGNEDDANENAYRHARTFIAVLFSQLRDIPGLLTKTMAAVVRGTTQFPEDSERARSGQSIRFRGAIIPPLAVNIEISSQLFGNVKQWYADRSNASEELQKRATTASHFVHYGIMSDGLERFINFFVALDALFGVRGDVESTIIGGIEQAFANDSAWTQRALKLFDLRNEVLHGGSSSIAQWKDLTAYTRQFRSDPLSDVGMAAMTALACFFTLSQSLSVHPSRRGCFGSSVRRSFQFIIGN